VRDAPDGWAGRGRMLEWKAISRGGVISEVGWALFVWRSPAEILCSAAQPCCVGGREREWKALHPRWKQFTVRLLLWGWAQGATCACGTKPRRGARCKYMVPRPLLAAPRRFLTQHIGVHYINHRTGRFRFDNDDDDDDDGLIRSVMRVYHRGVTQSLKSCQGFLLRGWKSTL
jgi:hypothetical protein